MSKFDRSVLYSCIFVSLSFWCLYGLVFFLSRNYWSSLDHDLMASIWEKAISILTGSLNSGRRYLITAAPYNLERQTKRSDSKTLPEIMPTTVWVFPQATARTLSGFSTLTHDGLSTFSLCPRPNSRMTLALDSRHKGTIINQN